MDIKFVINTDRKKSTANNANGLGVSPKASTIRFAIYAPAPDFTIAVPRAKEPTNSRIVFISIDLTASFSVITPVATITSAPTQALTAKDTPICFSKIIAAIVNTNTKLATHFFQTRT